MTVLGERAPLPEGKEPPLPEGKEPPLPEGRAKIDLVRSMFDTIAPRYDLVNRIITGGLDVTWRRRTISLLGVAPGAAVLDLGCGTADFARALSSAGRRTIGVDLSPGMLRSARPGRAPLVLGDAAALPLRTGSFDALVSGFALRNFADLRAVFLEAARVLGSGGRIAILEVGEPKSRIVRAADHIWISAIVPRIGAMLSDGAAYRYLPRSLAYLPSFQRLREMLVEAGFTDVDQHLLSGGLAQCVTATRLASR